MFYFIYRATGYIFGAYGIIPAKLPGMRRNMIWRLVSRSAVATKTSLPYRVLLLVLAPVLVPLIWCAFLVLALPLLLVFRLFYLCVWLSCLARTKNILFVYSDDPIWRDSMLSEVRPFLERRAVVLNWSERRSWNRRSLSFLAASHFGAKGAFRPFIVRLHLLDWPEVYRFDPVGRVWNPARNPVDDKSSHELIRALAWSS